MIWLFVVLKVPVVALCWLVWWAIHQEPELLEPPDDGGTKRTRPHPPEPLPRAPRRGPHADPAPPSPPRVRPVPPVSARGRELER